ncbi:MAG TPA: Wzz/FepE/Etk N-terminal domain-containing protein [Nitrospirota bacterium]|nr:Wzz/FepE/Etk N-terminal domain-containing protein [Nitrospirota bacterium]
MEESKITGIRDIVSIVKRRRWALSVPTFVILLLAALVLHFWKPVYRSTSTILIEEQEISREYVMAAVTSYAEQRLQQINQRIMSSSRLLDIIHRFNLYADKSNRLSSEEIIDDMRKKDIKFDIVMADVIDRRTGQKTTAAIAFTVSYEGNNPQVVQQVANELASLYLEENMKVVDQQTEGTTKFLEEEMNSVQATLADLERKIAVYKEQHSRALPELLQFNLQSLDWNERNRDQLNEQLRSLREKESYYQTELATMAPDTTNQDKERLKELRVVLNGLKARYSEEYPDVIKTKLEIANLEKKLQARTTETAAQDKPDNPGYVALAAQLASVQAEIKSIKQQLEELDRKQNDFRHRLEAAPKVEEGYKKLTVERNNTQAKYDDLMRKYMESKVAHGLEKEQMGERFTLIDPARLPEKPVRPNRQAILLIGLILGIGSGVGTASFQEASDRSARKAEDLVKNFPFPVLTEIPEILTFEDQLRKKKRLKIAVVSSFLLIIVITVVIHFFFMDLDVFFMRVLRHMPI